MTLIFRLLSQIIETCPKMEVKGKVCLKNMTNSLKALGKRPPFLGKTSNFPSMDMTASEVDVNVGLGMKQAL
jgi:hypothetical protein